MANKHVFGLQARQEIQLGQQQQELFAMNGAQSRLASQVNMLLGDNEHLEAHVAALEVQRDNMLHELQTAAILQVFRVSYHLVDQIVAIACCHVLARQHFSVHVTDS